MDRCSETQAASLGGMPGRRSKTSWPRLSVLALACWIFPWSQIRAAELSAGESAMRPGTTAQVVVSGTIDGEWTFGWSIMLELVPREGSTGTVTFTETPEGPPVRRSSFVVREVPGQLATVHLEQPRRFGVEVRQLRDVWGDVGTFTAFDTDRTGSALLNGAVDDNGSFVAGPVRFSGALSMFPVVASRDASGVWDVSLITSKGDSGWEGIETTLFSGAITVSDSACAASRDCDDQDPCTDDICDSGTCRHVALSDGSCSEGKPARKRNRTREESRD